MECNKNEAMRAMEMAEQKLASQDYAGARRLALKAQQLFPSLENIGQMIAVVDVHLAAQTRIGINEKDWYGVLQIEPTADDTLVKKQYRKLALFLHPDKNKLIGAESAFKLIGEALQVLSDKVKRLVYDAKRGMHAKVNCTFSASSETSNNCWQSQTFQQQQNQHQHQHYHHHQQHYSDISANAYNKTNQRHFPQPPHMPSEFHLFTFWTACTSCQMRYQYYRKYENQNLLCPQCRRPFIAKDLSAMRHTSFNQTWLPRAGESVLNGHQLHQSNFNMPTGYKSGSHTFANFNVSGCKYFNGFTNGGRSETFQMFSGATSFMNGKESVSGVKNEAHCMRSMQDCNEAEKELLRKIKELHRSTAKQSTKQKNPVKKASVSFNSCQTSARFSTKEAQGQFEAAKKQKLTNHDVDTSSSDLDEDDEFWDRDPVKSANDSKINSRQIKGNYSFTANGIVNNQQDVFLSKKAKFDTETCSTKQDLEAINMAKRLADLAKHAIRVKLNLQKTKAGVIDSATGQVSCKNGPLLKEKQGVVFDNKEIPAVKDNSMATCSVPDSDFHNFDVGREEKDVEVGQIWALYDDKDGMPKYYMKVKEVRSRSPFKVLIGWFELRKPSDELCELLDLGFSIACGEFRLSASQTMASVNSFSHLVNWEKCGKGLVKIYPKKDEIWCIHRDWEAGQQVFRVADGVVGFSMVEVVSDCREESGVSVVQLNKVVGFKTIFNSSLKAVIEIPFLEVLRFSHRVPARRLEGNEAAGLSGDCWELDPAAIPSFLVQLDQTVVPGTST